MTQLPIDFQAARARRDQGMASSEAHANDDAPGWSDQCFVLLCRFVDERTEPFTIEDFRPWAYSRGLSKPAEERAFGGVTQRAIRQGVMVRVGYKPTASSNGAVRATYAAPMPELAA